MNPKTEADLLFESYLREQGRTDFVYEELLPESAKPSDYQLPVPNGKPWLFEVKSFQGETPPGFGYFDPYKPLRRKIDKAIEKFKDLEGYSCSLVLHNSSPKLVLLDEPIVVIGSMLGDVGFEIPFDRETGTLRDEGTRRTFTRRGRMIEYGKGGIPKQPVNTTINALIVLERYPLGQRRFGQHYDRLRVEREAALSDEDAWMACFAEIEAARGTERDVSLHVLRAVVYENPYARIRLSRDLFNGPCDERYGADDEGRIVRLFAGETVAPLDAPAI